MKKHFLASGNEIKPFSVCRRTFILKIKNLEKTLHICSIWRSYDASVYGKTITTEANMRFFETTRMVILNEFFT